MGQKKTAGMPRLAALILTFIIILGFLAGFFGWRLYYDRRVPNFTGTAEIYVHPNMDILDVMEDIKEKKVPQERGAVVRFIQTGSDYAEAWTLYAYSVKLQHVRGPHA